MIETRNKLVNILEEVVENPKLQTSLDQMKNIGASHINQGTSE